MGRIVVKIPKDRKLRKHLRHVGNRQVPINHYNDDFILIRIDDTHGKVNPMDDAFLERRIKHDWNLRPKRHVKVPHNGFIVYEGKIIRFFYVKSYSTNPKKGKTYLKNVKIQHKFKDFINREVYFVPDYYPNPIMYINYEELKNKMIINSGMNTNYKRTARKKFNRIGRVNRNTF